MSATATARGRDVFWSRGWSSGVGKEAEVDAQATLLPHLTVPAPSHHHQQRGQPAVAPPPEYAELLGHCNGENHPNLSSFLPRRMMTSQPHPAAYATTTLVTQRSAVLANPFPGGSTFHSLVNSSPPPSLTNPLQEWFLYLNEYSSCSYSNCATLNSVFKQKPEKLLW